MMDMLHSWRAEAGGEPDLEARKKSELKIQPGSLGDVYEKYLSGIEGMLRVVEANPDGEMAQFVEKNQAVLQGSAEWFKATSKDQQALEKPALDYVTEAKTKLDGLKAEFEALNSLGEDVGEDVARTQELGQCLDFCGDFTCEVTGAFHGGATLEPQAVIIQALTPAAT